MKRGKHSSTSMLFDDGAPRAAISDIAICRRDPNQRDIRVDGRRIATIRAVDADELNLHVGMRWTAALARRIEHAKALDDARRKAMRILGTRARSRAQLIDRLQKAGHALAIAERVADEAQRDGWLNDKAFAEDVVRGATRRQAAGKRLLEDKLRSHGVNEELARDVVADAASRQDDRSTAMTLARRRLGTMGAVEPATALRRIAGLLARRGFEDDIVEETIEGIRLILRLPDRDA